MNWAIKLFCYVNEMPLGNPPGNYEGWLPGVHIQFQLSLVVQSQLSLVAQSCPALSDHMDCSTPGLPVLCHLLEFAQIQAH